MSEMCRIVPEETANMGNKQPKETEISQNQNPIGRIEEKNRRRRRRLVNVQEKRGGGE